MFFQVFFSKFVNVSNRMTASEYQLVTGGNSMQFWKIDGASLTRKQGRFGQKYKQVCSFHSFFRFYLNFFHLMNVDCFFQCPLLCAANMNTKDGWRVVTGTSTGDIFVFNEREVCSPQLQSIHCRSYLLECDLNCLGMRRRG